MKVAVIGSRNLTVEDLGQYLPEETTEIVSGGTKGVDACAREYVSRESRSSISSSGRRSASIFPKATRTSRFTTQF